MLLAMNLKFALSALRCCFLVGFTGLLVILLGPFQGLERTLGLTDSVAHCLAFYGLTVGLFIVLPRFRRIDIALGSLLLAASSEVAQSFTGRTGSLADFAADSFGIICAVSPAIADRWRHAFTQRAARSMGHAQLSSAKN